MSPLRPEQIVMDKSGFPAVHLKPSIGIDSAGRPILLAAAPKAAPAAPAPLIDRREILSLRQAAQVLGMALDDASRVLSLATIGRVVGFDAKDCHRLAVDLSRDAALRRELGLDKTGDEAA